MSGFAQARERLFKSGHRPWLCLGCFDGNDFLLVEGVDEQGMLHRFSGSTPVAADALAALVECAEALFAIRKRIPFDAENEDANAWGRVDAALAAFYEDCHESIEWDSTPRDGDERGTTTTGNPSSPEVGVKP